MDGYCSSNERCQSLPGGLRLVPDECGDGLCGYSEWCDFCPEDCGPCPFCGDDTCDVWMGGDVPVLPPGLRRLPGRVRDHICGFYEWCDTCAIGLRHVAGLRRRHLHLWQGERCETCKEDWPLPRLR